MVLLRRGKNDAIEWADQPIMRGWRYDQILTSEAFGLPSARNLGVAHLMERLRELYLHPSRTNEEEEDFQ